MCVCALVSALLPKGLYVWGLYVGLLSSESTEELFFFKCYLPFFFKKNIKYLFYTCVYTCVCVCVHVGLSSSVKVKEHWGSQVAPPTTWFPISNPGWQTWPQAPLPTEHSCQLKSRQFCLPFYRFLPEAKCHRSMETPWQHPGRKAHRKDSFGSRSVAPWWAPWFWVPLAQHPFFS